MSYSSEVLADSPLVYYRLAGSGAPQSTMTMTASSNFTAETPARTIDNSLATQWTSNATATGWLQAQLSSSAVVSSYAIYGYRSATPNRSPKSWTFEGSNDGSTWTTLDTQTNITNWSTVPYQIFTCSNTTAYSYYRLNISANNGDSYLNVVQFSLAPLVDSSGNARNGWFAGTQSYGASSLLVSTSNAATTFQGSGFGLTPNDTWMNSASAPFSVEAWVKTTATGYRDIVTRYDSTGNRTFTFRIDTTSGALQFIKLQNGTTTSTGTTNVRDGNAHHVVATYDGTNIRLYVDKVLDQTTSATGVLSAGTSALRVGDNGGTSEAFDGVIDEVAVYSSTLSAARIAAHYDAGVATSADATVSAVAATATASATAPAVTADATVTAPTATATAAATEPTVSGAGDATVNPPAATVTAEALPPTLAWDANLAAATATATADALAPTVTAHAAIAAPAATATATAEPPDIDNGSGNRTVAAPVATATATAHAPVFTANYEVGTDTTNTFTGLDLTARGTVTIAYPAATPTVDLGTRVDAALPYPQPVMDDGRPT